MTVAVSIIVPVYKVEAYIDACLASLVGQTLREIEIVCIDDCGGDRSMEIVRSYAKGDPRIVIIENEQNLGVGPSRNRGMEAARGDYIGFVDPDDWVDLDFFGSLYKKASNSCAEIVFGGVKRHTGRSVKDITPKKPNLSKGLFSLGCFWRGLYLKSFLEEHDITFPPISVGEDVVFLLNSQFSVKKMYCVEGYFYHYRVRSGSLMTSPTQENIFDRIRSIAEMVEVLNKSKVPKDYYINYLHEISIVSICRFYREWARDFPCDDPFFEKLSKELRLIFDKCRYKEELVRGRSEAVYDYLLHDPPLPYTDLKKFFEDDCKVYYMFGSIPFFKIKRKKGLVKFYIMGILFRKKVFLRDKK